MEDCAVFRELEITAVQDAARTPDDYTTGSFSINTSNQFSTMVNLLGIAAAAPSAPAGGVIIKTDCHQVLRTGEITMIHDPGNSQGKYPPLFNRRAENNNRQL